MGLAVAAAFILSLYTYGSLPRYQTQEGEYIRNAGFAQAPGSLYELTETETPPEWLSERYSGTIRFQRSLDEAGRVTLENADPYRRVRLHQIIDLHGQHLFELSATVAATAVVTGGQRWHTARVDFAGLRPDGERDHSRRHVLFDGEGTIPERTVKRFFELDPAYDQAQLTLQLSNATGRFEVSGLSLKPAIHDPLFVVMDKAARLAWAAVIGLASLLFWRGAAHRPAALGAIALAGLGASLVLLPTGFRGTLTAWAHFGEATEWVWRALHFMGFVALGFLAALARRRERPRQILPYLLVLALGAEAIQIVSGSLGPDDLIDGAINIAGIVAGVFVGGGMAEEHIKAKYGRRRRKRRKSVSEDKSMALEPE